MHRHAKRGRDDLQAEDREQVNGQVLTPKTAAIALCCGGQAYIDAQGSCHAPLWRSVQ